MDAAVVPFRKAGDFLDPVSLSKTISHALRHAPWQYELEIDENGWAPTAQLISALREEERYAGVTGADLRAIVDADDKGRYEMDATRIRALYGHSFPLKIAKARCTPPDVLYHGTARRFLPSILSAGLTPQNRQYVHLSATEQIAQSVGRRRDGKPAMLKIDAARAHADGIVFYSGSQSIFLADIIPPEYISIL